MSNYPTTASDDPLAPYNKREDVDYLGHTVQPEEFEDARMIHVGLPFLSNSHNGYVKAKAQDGEVWLTVKGFGTGELSMPKEQAIELRDQINNAIQQA